MTTACCQPPLLLRVLSLEGGVHLLRTVGDLPLQYRSNPILPLWRLLALLLLVIR